MTWVLAYLGSLAFAAFCLWLWKGHRLKQDLIDYVRHVEAGWTGVVADVRKDVARVEAAASSLPSEIHDKVRALEETVSELSLKSTRRP